MAVVRPGGMTPVGKISLCLAILTTGAAMLTNLLRDDGAPGPLVVAAVVTCAVAGATALGYGPTWMTGDDRRE